MSYKFIIFVLILSSLGIGFFPYQASVLRIVGIIYLISQKELSNKNIVVIAITTILAVVHYMLFRQISIVPFYLTVVFVTLLRKLILKDEFKVHFIQLTTVLSLLTIVSALLGFGKASFAHLYINSSIYKRIGIFLYTYLPSHVLGFEYYRPVLFFLEPGSYQLIFTLALFWNLYFHGLFNSKGILLSLGLLANFSSAGLISLVLLFALYYFKVRSVAGIVFGLALVLPIYSVVSANLFDKFYGENSASSIARIVDIQNGVYLWKQKPIIGHGILDSKEYSKISTRQFYRKYYAADDVTQSTLYERGNSVGVINVLLSFGLLGLLLLIFLFIRYSEKNLVWKLILCIYSLAQPLLLTPLVLLLFTSGRAKSGRTHSRN